jgi:predicted Zn-dependent protease
MRKLFIIMVACVAVLLAGYAGYRGYKVWKNKHLMSLGHQFLAKSDARNAILAVQEVLRSDPNNLDATRVMAQLAEASRSPAALVWRSRVVELNPHSLDDRLALAETALSMRAYADATNALEGVNADGKKTAAFHNMAGAVDAAINKTAEAEEHFLEASRLEPQNPAPQLNLAVVRLHRTNELELAEARTALDRLASNRTNSALRCQALRELTLDAMRHKQESMGLALSKQLTQETNCAFTDWILRLEVLLETTNTAFKPTLAACQHEAATNQSKLYEMATWEMAKTSPAEALTWLRSLPMTTQTNQPATLLEAECCMAAKDWRGLQTWLEKQRWAETEFLRHALMSRALRGQELAETSKTEWEQALKAANSQKQSLVMLLRLAAQWGWVSEGEDILQTIVSRYPQDKWAEQALAQTLLAGGQTRSLMQLFNQELKRTPGNLALKNNLAMTAMLLDAKELKPHDLAREVYQQAPTNSSFAATYAFSLYLQGKKPEALKVMQQIRPQDLENPSIAGYYGMILKATGGGANAASYLDKAVDKASKAPLLPEERKLFEQARAGM